MESSEGTRMTPERLTAQLDAVAKIEKGGRFIVVALVDDGGAFVKSVHGGLPVRLTHKKLLSFATIKAPR